MKRADKNRAAKRPGKRVWRLAAVWLLALVIAGCGAATSSATSAAPDTALYTDSDEDWTQSSGTLERNSIASAAAESLSEESSDDAAVDAAADSGEAQISDAADGDEGDGTEESSVPTPEQIRRKIVYSGDVYLESREYDTTRSQVTALVDQYDGFLESSSEYDNGSEERRQRSWQITVKIPAEHFQEFMNGLNGVTGKVTSQNITSSDMTRTYSDNADRIEALETEQKTLLALLAKADSVDAMIAIQSQLTDVRTELAQLHHANSGIDYDVRYSSVNLSLDEVVTYEASHVTFGQRLRDAFGGSGSAFVDFLQELVIVLIYLLPYLVLVFVLVLVIVKLIRRHRKNRRKKELKVSSGDGPGKSKEEADGRQGAADRAAKEARELKQSESQALKEAKKAAEEDPAGGEEKSSGEESGRK